MREYFWKLQKYDGQATRFRCPSCGKSRQYTRFVNSDGQHADFEFGKCNREEKCGYYRPPNGIMSTAPKFEYKPEIIEFIDWSEYNYNLDTGSEFVKTLIGLFGREKVLDTLKKYYVRTEENSMLYPYIDEKNRLTYVKKMAYKGVNRKGGIYTPYKAKKGRFKQCLFGLHLVNQQRQNCVVESEKTALICDIFYPKYTWLATGGLGMISKIKVLDCATVFADKGKAFIDWSDKLDATKYSMNTKIEESDLEDSEDLADLILRDLK